MSRSPGRPRQGPEDVPSRSRPREKCPGPGRSAPALGEVPRPWEKYPPAPAGGERVGRALNPGTARYVYVGEHKTMKSAVPAAHGAPWGRPRWHCLLPLLLIPALSAGIRRKDRPGAISYKVITVTKGRLDRSHLP